MNAPSDLDEKRMRYAVIDKEIEHLRHSIRVLQTRVDALQEEAGDIETELDEELPF